METTRKRTRNLVQQSGAAVRDALRQSSSVAGWKSLQERDADGRATGPLPYSQQALDAFDDAHRLDPDNIGIVHHLAIAHHSLAWDLELQGDPGATRHWELALGFWRVVASSAEFWRDLKGKLHNYDPQADPSVLDRTRANLMPDLLDIHVSFIRYYCERDEVARALSHVSIVKCAMIPLAVKKRLVGEVFEAMTCGVPAARQSQAYDSAVITVERFLALFPDYLRALRLYAEVCGEWASQLSFRDDWDQIVALETKARPYVECLAAHPELATQLLAVTALTNLAGHIAQHCIDRADVEGIHDDATAAARDAAQVALRIGVHWGRLGVPHAAGHDHVRKAFAACLNRRAALLNQEINEVIADTSDARTSIRVALDLCRTAVADLQEAIRADPRNAVLAGNLEVMAGNLATLESQNSLFGLTWSDDE